ncbi:MAG: SDR family oxidoreductase [Anaerolineae bacterium]
MNILIIGGTRFIGPPVVRELTAAGHRVAVFTRGTHPANLPEGVQHLTGDMNRLHETRAAFLAFQPDVVLHTMIITEAHARELMDIFQGIAARVVMLSSMDVYRAYGRLIGLEPGPPEPVPYDEEAPLRAERYPYRALAPGPEHPMYHYDKIPAEEIVMGDPYLPGTVLRLPMVIGPGDYQHRLYMFLRPMVDGRPVIVMGEAYAAWRSTYGYVDNVAHAIALACTDARATRRVYNVGWPVALSMQALGEKVGAAMQWAGVIVTVPEPELPPILQPDFDTRHHLVASTERIRTELGYTEPVDIDEGIRRTVAWELANPPDPLPEGAEDYYVAEDQLLRQLGKLP